MTTKLPDVREYTHSKLVEKGYVRVVHKAYPGWVTYEHPNRKEPRIGFAGNDATMNNWIEEVSNWKRNFPEIYKWWGDPKQTIIHYKPTDEILIKGEDPMLAENSHD